MYGAIEIALTIGIIIVAIRWPRKTENEEDLHT